MTPIVVSKHAMERMRERYPGVAEQIVMWEVRAAIDAGRRAKTRPVWASTYTRTKGRNVRFAWTEAKDRCYVIAPKRIGGQGNGWLVITALAPGRPEMLDRKAWSKGEPNQTKTGQHAPRSSRVWKRGHQL